MKITCNPDVVKKIKQINANEVVCYPLIVKNQPKIIRFKKDNFSNFENLSNIGLKRKRIKNTKNFDLESNTNQND